MCDNTDDYFNRTDDGKLGEAWTQSYTGCGVGRIQSDGGEAAWVSTTFNMPNVPIVATSNDGSLNFYGRMPHGRPDASSVGARLRADTVCTGCGKRPQKGDHLTAYLLPNMAGTWHHTDCDNPKMEDDPR